jgi:hypothetical protein
MYTFVKMIAKARGKYGDWFETDDSSLPVRKIGGLYNKCYLVLSNPYYQQNVTLDCAEVEEIFSNQTNTTTVAEWLVATGNNSLPVMEKEFKLNFEYVQYRDAIQAGWSPELCHRTVHHTIPIPKSEKNDLRLTKVGVPKKLFLENCLVSVNNLLHYCMDGTEESVQVIDAGVSNRIYNDNHIGILNFERVGKITTVPITVDMVYGSDANTSLSDLCVIKLPESYDVEKYLPMISIGGFLHSLGTIFSYIGNNCYKVDLGNFGWESRYFEVLKRLDLTSLHLHMTEKNGSFTQVANEELFSDEVLTALLTLSNSFVILIDNPNVVTKLIPLEVTQTPGVYLTKSPIHLPVLYNKGLLYDSWVIDELGRSVVKGKENFRPTYNHETTHVFEEHSIDDTQYSYEPNRFSQAFMWSIATAKFE